MQYKCNESYCKLERRESFGRRRIFMSKLRERTAFLFDTDRIVKLVWHAVIYRFKIDLDAETQYC